MRTENVYGEFTRIAVCVATARMSVACNLDRKARNVKGANAGTLSTNRKGGEKRLMVVESQNGRAEKPHLSGGEAGKRRSGR
jgi:hypothetical protein